MTYAPPTLVALGTYWKAHGGVNLGIVGDTNHQLKGTSYHLGKDNLIATAYSIKTARDKAGLTNAASAIDLGKLNGSLTNLRKFSNWLYAQARKNAPGTGDFREIIWSPDGTVVLRWDRERGYTSGAKPGEADDSHLTHTHVSWYRDAEKRDHTTAFRPYFETGGTDVGIGLNLAATKDTNPYDALGTAKLTVAGLRRVKDDVAVALAAGTDLGVVQLGTRVDNNAAIVALNHLGELHITSRSSVTFVPLPPPAGSQPPTAATCKPYSDAAHIAGAQAEWDRQNAGATVDVLLLPRP